MNKVIRLIKKLTALFIVLVFCIESLAAVVSDNDGSAFITKAEFDSLKNNFQSQIDQYNTSIDSKIDGAIASYLAGIKVEKETILANLVSNYADILWRRKFEVYGEYRDWTSTSASTKVGPLWFEPHFQKRATVREADFTVASSLSRWSHGYIFAMRGSINPATSNGAVMSCNYGAGNPWMVLMRCSPERDDEIMLEPTGEVICKINSNNSYINSIGEAGSPHYYDNSDGQWKGFTNNGHSVNPVLDTGSVWLEDLGGSNYLINCYVYFNYDNNRSLRGRFLFQKRASKFPWIAPVTITNMVDATDVGTTTWENSALTSPTLFSSNGGHVYADQSWHTNYTNQWRYSMLGDDNTVTANMYRVYTDVFTGSQAYTKSIYSDYYDMPWNVSEVTAAGSVIWYTASDRPNSVTHATPKQINLHVPYYERYPLRQITSGMFKNGEDNLKFGSGMPISTYIYDNGKIEISFNYALEKLRPADTDPSDKKIKIDIKKTNFLSGIDDYYVGSIDGGTERELKNAVSIADDKVKIVIENVKSGDAMWMRIAPNTTTGGIAAKMSNLFVKSLAD